MSASPPTKVSARRYLAHLIDALIRIAAAVVPFVLLAERVTLERAQALDPRFNPDAYERVDTFAIGADRAIRIDDRVFIFERSELIVIAAIAVGVTLLLDVIVQGRFGWTPGKLLSGLRTVTRTGERPGILRAFVRTVLLVVDLIPSYLIPLVGGLFIFASDTNRRLGDLVAGTFVVDRAAWGEDPSDGGEVESDWDRGDLETHPGHVTTLEADEPLRVGDAEPVSRPTPGPQGGPDGNGGDRTSRSPAYQPQWDPARKAYLQWDPRRETWLQFDDDSQEWKPIG